MASVNETDFLEGSEEIQFELVPGARSDGRLLYTTEEQQLFRKKSKYKDQGYWYRCRIRKCGATVFLDSNEKKCRKSKKGPNRIHSHPDNQSSVCTELKLAHKIKTECKELSALDSGARPISEIFHRNVRLENETLNFEKMARNLYRLRSITMPPSPKTASDVALCFQDENMMKNFGTSLLDDGSTAPFYRSVFKSDAFSFCIFASASIIRNIEIHINPESRNYVMDGTFKIVPYGEFSHLLIIHIYHLEKITPFIFVLSSRKTEACYKQIFEQIEQKIFNLQANSFTADYEQALRSALFEVFPRTAHFNCWFHYCQALRRHANAIPGFVNAIRNNVGAMKIYAKFQSLPYLPHKLIIEAFREIKNEAMLYDKDLFHHFLIYFEKQWIRKEGPQAISVYEKETRTTNALEAYNGVIGKRILTKVNFFRFCLSLLKEEYAKSRAFANMIGTEGGYQKRKYSSRYDKIVEATGLLKQQKLSPSEFLINLNKLELDISCFDNVGKNEDDDIVMELQTYEDPSDIPRLNDEVAQPKRNCIKCFTNPFEMFMPCGHVCLCEGCFIRLKIAATDNEMHELMVKCPMCCQPCLSKNVVKCFFPV